ncbi:unnamed protein product, partial [Didymodactylos carnosus]
DKRLSEYTEKHFERENIEIITNTRVKNVKQREVIVQHKGSNDLLSIPCSIILWATGIQSIPLINNLRETIDVNIQTNRTGLITDTYLRVKGIADHSIYAVGDCATVEQRKLVDYIKTLFEEADTVKDDALDLQEFRQLIESKVKEFPQFEIYQKNIENAFHNADKEQAGRLKFEHLHDILEKADKKLRAYPPTAQLALQQGDYVASLLNKMSTGDSSNLIQPFRFNYKGSLAYVGGDAAVIDFTGSPLLKIFNIKPLSGKGSYYLWKSFYFTEMFTMRTKCLLAFDWIKLKLFGRDISRY